MELTRVQKDLYDELVNNIQIAKTSKDIKEYYINLQMQYINKERKDYDKCLQHYIDKYNASQSEIYKIYNQSYEEAKNNITRVYSNSNTLRALAKKGYIEIITDGKNNIDKVKVL